MSLSIKQMEAIAESIASAAADNVDDYLWTAINTPITELDPELEMTSENYEDIFDLARTMILDRIR